MAGVRPSLLVILAMLLGQAGCALSPPAKPVVTTHPLRHRHPYAASASASSAARALHRQRPEDRPPPPPDAAPVNVVGLSQTQVRRSLGTPAERATHGPAQTWTYRSEGCSVRITFYYDVTRGDFFALSQQAADGEDRQNCPTLIHDDHLS